MENSMLHTIKPRRDDKILILGAQGNLGSQLMRVLGNEYRLLCWDKDDFDASNFTLLAEKIMEHKPNVIINTVAYNAVDKCEEDEREFAKAKLLNEALPSRLADLCLKLNATFVQFISDYVFDGENKAGYTEDAKTRAINRYGETKLAGEKAVLEIAADSLKYYLIRTSKLFGPKGRSENSKPSFFDQMLELSKSKNELDVVDDEAACFTYTPDLAKAIKDLLEENREYGIYHIVNSGPATWYEAAKTLFKLAKKKIKINPVSSDKFPRPAKRPKYTELKNTKLKPLRSYKEALKDYIENYVIDTVRSAKQFSFSVVCLKK
jgi:dTDP-4-dehydrorhamnose reductase